jgi:hypothetical protein
MKEKLERGNTMPKEKELEMISKETKQAIELFEKRDILNTQMIEELDKQLVSSKYGSVGHVNKITRLSSLRNYKLRLQEVIEAFKQIVDYKSLETIEGYIVKVLEDSKTNLKTSSTSLDSVEIFSNDYIKYEILVKTYKELSDLYSEVIEVLKKIKETVRPEQAPKQEQEVPPTPEQTSAVEQKQTKKETA